MPVCCGVWFMCLCVCVCVFLSALGFVCLLIIWKIVSSGYDRQNKIILTIKKIIPSHLARNIKKTIFFIPDLKEKNRVLELQVKKFEQDLNGELFKENIFLLIKKKDLRLKSFFYHFPD